MPPVSATSVKTAILLIDIQNAFHISDVLGTSRNNEHLEANIQILVDATRQWNEKQKLACDRLGNRLEMFVDIIHVRHHSSDPQSPLHPSFTTTVNSLITRPGTDEFEVQEKKIRGIDAMPCAKEIDGEPIFTKNVNSAFIGTSLEEHIRQRQIRQLFICGLTTDHCVSTSTRMAANLKVVDSLDSPEPGNILLVEDACATFQRGEFPAETVHKVEIASLKDEFADVTTTQDILEDVLTPLWYHGHRICS